MVIRNMTESDLPSALRLKTMAGWNQTVADWKRFMDASPTGCFVAEVDGEVRGTVTTISFEHRFAWVGMVLVDPEYRSKGIGTSLLHKAIGHLDDAKVPTVKLDATPQGKPLYEKLGFVAEYDIERWSLQRPAGKSSPGHPRTESASTELPASLFQMDRESFGAGRADLLKSLHRDAPDFTLEVRTNEGLQGYAFGRRGSFADHLGPWIAKDADTARTLLQSFLVRSIRETVIADCLKNNAIAVDLLKCSGFVYARPLTRMYRGPNDYPGRPESVCAIMGPEFG
jgi:GNAT superfamily N-acetyltransferase